MISFFSFRQVLFVGAISALFLFFTISSPVYAQQDGGFCAALLSGNPDGGVSLEDEVKNLVAAAPDSAESMIGCAAGASKEQAAAIGKGLSQAVAGLKETNPELADKIAALVAGSDNKQLIAAYSGGQAEEATAATNNDGAVDAGGDAVNDGAGGVAPAFGVGGRSAPVLTVGTSGGGGTGGGGSVSPN